MLILVGVVLNLTLGEHGIFKTAQMAAKNYTEAEKKEQEELTKLYKELGIENLPENSKEHPQDVGKEVALKDGWGQETVTYTNTKNGLEVTGLTKVATVYAISVGNGDTVPIPKGFFYVGGTLDNGVIISDNEEDKYDGITDKTTHEYAPNLKGNQFVWIPCSLDNYKKNTNWNGTIQANGTLASIKWDPSTSSAEKTQIEKYGGFYVGRYEAGTSEIKGIDFASAYTCTSMWEKPKMDYRNASGNVTSKANEIPYYYADHWTAVEMSERMYRNHQYVNSGLITGTMWDVMLKTMNKKTSCSTTLSNWGNYEDCQITDARGKYTYIKDTTGNDKGSNTAWENNVDNNNVKTTINGVRYFKLLSTGASDVTQKMHIYDVAGNLWEQTDEIALNANEPYYVMRGGCFTNGYGVTSHTYPRPASYRSTESASVGSTYNGFRVVLYIK